MHPYRLFALILLTIGSALVASEILGGACSLDSDCLLHAADTECVNSTCACSSGYYCPVSEFYCARIEPGAVCSAANDRCAEWISNLACDASRLLCDCPTNQNVVVQSDGTRVCSPASPDATCATCSYSGGFCFADVTNSNTLSCQCPQNAEASDGLTSGCDLVYAPVKGGCSVNGSPRCLDPNSACRHSGLLDNNYNCQCKFGFATVPRAHDPKQFDCLKMQSQYDDADCSTCIDNFGQCLDTNGDGRMDTCHCPPTRSSSTLAASDACDTLHFSVACNATHYTVCYIAENDPYHGAIIDRLVAGTALLYIVNYADDTDCHLELMQDGSFCRTFDFTNLVECSTAMLNTSQEVTYSNWIMLQRDLAHISPNDVAIHAECKWEKLSFSSSGIVSVKDDHRYGIEGVHKVATLALSVLDRSGNALVTGSALGDDIKLRMEVIDDADTYNAARVEICIASNTLSLSHPGLEASVFIMNACPRTDHQLNNINFHHVDGLNYETGLFPLPSFGNEYIYFHCSVKVCVLEGECAPKACSRRRKRSLTPDILRMLQSNEYQLEVVGVRILHDVPFVKDTGRGIDEEGESVVEKGAEPDEELAGIAMWFIPMIVLIVLLAVSVFVGAFYICCFSSPTPLN